MTDDLELARNRFDCCEHCEVYDAHEPGHPVPCDHGCNDDEEEL